MAYVEEQNLDFKGDTKVLPVAEPGATLPIGYVEQQTLDFEGNIKVLPVYDLSGGGGGSGAIISVNGKTGIVILTTDDIKDTSNKTITQLLSEKLNLTGGELTGMVRIINSETPLVVKPIVTPDGYRTFFLGIENDALGNERTLLEIYSDQQAVYLKGVNVFTGDKIIFRLHPTDRPQVQQNNGNFKDLALLEDITNSTFDKRRFTVKCISTTALPTTGSVTTNIIPIVGVRNDGNVGILTSNNITLVAGSYEITAKITLNKTGNNGKAVELALLVNGAVAPEGRQYISYGADTSGNQTYNYSGFVDLDGTQQISFGILADTTGLSYHTVADTSALLVTFEKR